MEFNADNAMDNNNGEGMATCPTCGAMVSAEEKESHDQTHAGGESQEGAPATPETPEASADTTEGGDASTSGQAGDENNENNGML